VGECVGQERAINPITASILGGDAINGKHENGRYYFYNKKPPTSKSAPQSSTTAASTPTPSPHAAAGIAVVTLLWSRRGQSAAPI